MASRYAKRQSTSSKDWRMKALRFFFLAFVLVIVFRLFTLQVVSAGFYNQLASGQHSFYQELFAERGNIYMRDWRDGQEYVVATNEAKAFIFADPRRIEDPEATAKALANIFGWEIIERIEVVEESAASGENDDLIAFAIGEVLGETEELDSPPDMEGVGEADEGPGKYEVLLRRLSKTNDPYEPVERSVNDATLQRILELDLDGIAYVLEKSRSYPEKNLGGQIFGFVGSNSDGGKEGFYGIEGYFDNFLAGESGFIDSETDTAGRWIGVGNRNFDPAEDGGDILLTLDRTIQYTLCEKLREGVERFDAEGGSVVVMEPSTGRIMAMCTVPDFDPNTYNEVEDIAVYNNAVVAGPYEIGSVFKPLIMAAAIDQGAVSPNMIYEDLGEEKIDEFTIRNSDLKAYGWQSMTEVLEKSLNTGMIFVMRQMSFDSMEKYIKDFGFGTLTGIQVTGESAGNIASLENKYEIYYATASYGQGITATPLQLVAAYGALANGGMLMSPYIVQEKRLADGTVEETLPKALRQVVSKKTATTIGAMMVSVIENGHGENAAVDGYYLAGKTGTAQVAKTQGVGYRRDYTKATFVGFGPVDNPAFVMSVMLDHPRAVPWAADTAAPIWGEMADYILQYLELAPTRSVN
jgi:cell division protein FtsI/penicillin-binding protein 2